MSLAEDAAKRVNRQELIDLALTICNIDSAGPTEARVKAHMDTFGNPPPPSNPATCSMWRDVNIFNEVGIPALTYGPRSDRHSHKRAFPIDALYQASCVYARIIVDLCNQERPKPNPRARKS